jgi:two-component sensor histidine kinase
MALMEVDLRGAPPPDVPDLMRETNHRIANHLSLLVGMVHTQSSALSKGPETVTRDAARAMLRETAGKIISVGLLHRRLAEQDHKQDINIGDFLIETSTTLVSSLALGAQVNVVQRLGANSHVTPEQAQQLGLMVNEILMNAIKHAHPTGIPVQIAVGCRREADGRLTIEIGDDGVGLPENSDPATCGGVGFRLIRSLAQALNAELRIESDALGLTFLITLPAEVHALGIAAD